ncbi:glycosyltransferase family 4 protein [Albibacterium indicum]|uniref:glycosyltransferase family 4 protein n=1 Tax=Albibacterium indicum TaxID=2292082 RepID=UPI000E4892C0|nr:glycosyltransferase family 4 protein [Pedobacter indicus]
MRIVYNIAATYNSGGMERVLANKANYLVRQGHEVMVVTTDQQGRKPYFELDNRITHHDLGINYSAGQGKGLLEKAVSYWFKQRLHKRRLEKLLIGHKADIVISMFDHEVSFLHGIADGSKKVAEIHFSRFKRLQYGRKGLWGLVDSWRSKRDQKLAGCYDRFVVLTHEDSAYWAGLSNINVIPNANSFEPSKVASLDEKRVIAVGRYDYQKAFDELIYIWKEIKTRYPDWKLFIYGDGPRRKELEELIKALYLQDVVQLLPSVKDIENEYLKSSVLVMTSRYEGLPMALLEGQACGLPLVAYGCKCGPKDVIDDGRNGYLIAEGDRHSFAEKLMLLMGNADTRKQMGHEAKRLSASFSEEVIMAKWRALFDGLLQEGGER